MLDQVIRFGPKAGEKKHSKESTYQNSEAGVGTLEITFRALLFLPSSPSEEEEATRTDGDDERAASCPICVAVAVFGEFGSGIESTPSVRTESPGPTRTAPSSRPDAVRHRE